MDLGPPIQTHFGISLTMSYLVEAQGKQRRSHMNMGSADSQRTPRLCGGNYVLSAYVLPDSELSLRV